MTPMEGFQVAAELGAILSGRGVDLSGEQQTKTKAALRRQCGNRCRGITAGMSRVAFRC
jgi:hypothetical protein